LYRLRFFICQAKISAFSLPNFPLFDTNNFFKQTAMQKADLSAKACHSGKAAPCGGKHGIQFTMQIRHLPRKQSARPDDRAKASRASVQKAEHSASRLPSTGIARAKSLLFRDIFYLTTACL